MPELTSQQIVDVGNNGASLVSEFSDGLIMLERWRLQWVDYQTANFIELLDIQLKNADGGPVWTILDKAP